MKPTLKNLRPALLAGLVALSMAATGTSFAQSSIWTNPIDGTNPSSTNPFITGQTVNPNITVSGIGSGSGTGANNANNRYNLNSWNTTSLDPTAYFTFTLDANPGFEIDFTSFVYTGQASSSFSSPQLALRSSLDNFGSNIGSPTSGGTTISLSAGTYQNLTAPIEFRLYVWNAPAATATYSVNDFTFNGTVSQAAPANNDTVIAASTSAVAFGRVIQGSANPVDNVNLNKTGGNATTYTATTAGNATVAGNTDAFAAGAQTDAITVGIDRSTTGVKAGTVTVDNTATTSNGAGQGSADPNEVISVTGTVVADREIDGSVNVGKVFVGTSVSGTATLTTTGDSDHFTTVTVNGDAVVQGNASVAAGVTTTFDDASDTVSREITGTFGQSGNGQSLSVDLNVTGEGLAGENAGATATLQADVYQHALLAANDSATLGNNDVATVFNEFSDDGGQRAAAVISSKTVTGAGWSATDFEGGSESGTIAESEEVTATVSFDSVNKLNGSHVGSLVVGFEDEAGIAGGGSLGSKSWALSANVSGNTAQTGVAQTATVLAGNSFAGFDTTHASGLATQIALRAGTAVSTANVEVTFSDIGAGALSGVANDATRVSDIVSLEGTGSNVIVLQLSYNDAGIADESTVALFWLASGSEEWTLATAGNTGAGALAGAYEMSYDAFLAANGGVFDGVAMLGAYGVDTTGNTTWVVINHNSDFAVNVVPEPGTVALFALGGAFLCGVRRRYQVRA